jgi:hypothetical protein
MKRILVPALILGVLSMFSVVGCGETTKTEDTTKVTTPGGTDTVKQTTEEKKTGDAKTTP